ncbi:MAG: hypothetical protein AAF726_04365 [Planctomycetota bacterium]
MAEARAHRDRGSLVVPLDGTLPPICVLTGEPTDRTERHSIEVASRPVRWVAACIMNHDLQEWFTKKVDLELPLGDGVAAIRRRRREKARLSLAVGFGALGAFLFGDLVAWRWLGFMPVVALIAIAFGLGLALQPLPLPYGTRVRDGRVWLRGVHDGALAGLPEWRGGRTPSRGE